MNKFIITLIILVFSFTSLFSQLISADRTMSAMVLANKYFMEKWPNAGTAMFTYSIAWCINKGLISRKKYLPVVNKAWNALVTEALHPNGFLGYVQGTGKQPSDSQPVGYDTVPNFEDFGLGCFLLAGSEMYRMN